MCNEGMKNICNFFTMSFVFLYIERTKNGRWFLWRGTFLGASVHLYVTNTILVFYWFLIVSPNLECSENVPGVLEKEGNFGIIT